jgi:hypothetical protein
MIVVAPDISYRDPALAVLFAVVQALGNSSSLKKEIKGTISQAFFDSDFRQTYSPCPDWKE